MYDIARKGFTVQGNEFSLYMLFASHYILNVCDTPGDDQKTYLGPPDLASSNIYPPEVIKVHVHL